ncbi:hypothetical protein OL239_08100 [Arthrobacter sp. ATA002]|uniref:hypothetical protein n=1 Tax=Arthrobacter sp. ATA002 TaxID=2991715 RepID=UPI0022A7B5A5|nr:hypothetical protein [Arthrobacter sp. ATA002]WAP53042.1 hypothetical protein OL239_08100 [Arthrobacter sp. ATA002]
MHVGDFGLDWPGPKRGRYEAKLNRYLIDLGLTLIVSGGNHDNWDTLLKLPMDADGLGTRRSNIRVLPRGGRTQIEGSPSAAWAGRSASTTGTAPRAGKGLVERRGTDGGGRPETDRWRTR